MTRRATLLSLSVLVSVCGGAACTRQQRPRGSFGDGVALSDLPSAQEPSTARPAVPAGTVSLSDADLAPVDAYVARRRWLVGDDVEIVASREYFVQTLMIAQSAGRVRREEAEDGGGATISLTFVGDPAQVDVTTAPRVMIGTGLNVSARRRIVVRFTKTTDTAVPVRLQVTARGLASVGSGDQVERKGDPIVLGGVLARTPSGDYSFREIDR